MSYLFCIIIIKAALAFKSQCRHALPLDEYLERCNGNSYYR